MVMVVSGVFAVSLLILVWRTISQHGLPAQIRGKEETVPASGMNRELAAVFYGVPYSCDDSFPGQYCFHPGGRRRECLQVGLVGKPDGPCVDAKGFFSRCFSSCSEGCVGLYARYIDFRFSASISRPFLLSADGEK